MLPHPSASFAFNHVERREKRRLVFAKSFSACEKGCLGLGSTRGCCSTPGLGWAGLGLSLIINNENDGVKSCRCAMPNAGISHSWSKRLVSSRLLSRGCSRIGVKYLLMGTRQVVASHSRTLCVCNLTRGYKLRNCVHFKKRKLHNSATYGLSAARTSTRSSTQCECECEF